MLIVLAFWILFIRNSNVIVVPLCKYRLVADNAVKLSEQSLVLFMDYGQFYLYGDDDGFGRETDLLELAMASRPAYSDGTVVIVLSPHQNNFNMHTTVEVWSSRPTSDREKWQQVSESFLTVGPQGSISFDSPPGGEFIVCDVPEGSYLVEIAGRGFVNYGWPGSTEPGDVWRVRMWPAGGDEVRPSLQWDMPGYGVPVDEPIPEPIPRPQRDIESKWITIYGENGEPSRVVQISDLRAEAAERERQEWGGDPMPELERFQSGKDLARMDRPLVEAVVRMNVATLRRLAFWAAVQAYEHAGLADRDWVRPALNAMHVGQQLPEPFGNRTAAFEHLHEEEFGAGTENVELEVKIEIVDHSPQPESNPFDHGNIHVPSYALNAIFDAIESDPLTAAVNALGTAAVTFGKDIRMLFARARVEFDLED